MTAQPFLIRQIFQKDNHHFVIEWNDQVKQTFRLSDLQKKCPCALCMESRKTSEAFSKNVREDVRALFIKSVGRYALRIQFTSGCSTGIYGFDQLRQMSEC